MQTFERRPAIEWHHPSIESVMELASGFSLALQREVPDGQISCMVVVHLRNTTDNCDRRVHQSIDGCCGIIMWNKIYNILQDKKRTVRTDATHVHKVFGLLRRLAFEIDQSLTTRDGYWCLPNRRTRNTPGRHCRRQPATAMKQSLMSICKASDGQVKMLFCALCVHPHPHAKAWKACAATGEFKGHTLSHTLVSVPFA